MPTLPIPQIDPPATRRSDTEPGIGPVPHPAASIKKMARKPAFRTPVYVRDQDERGIDYGMNHKAEKDLEVTIPLPVRSSLAQPISIFKVQFSHYLARIAGASRYPGMAPGYPTAKVLTMLNVAPRMAVKQATPRGVTGRPSRQGYMNAPQRFKKALPLPINDYQPPVYGR